MIPSSMKSVFSGLMPQALLRVLPVALIATVGIWVLAQRQWLSSFDTQVNHRLNIQSTEHAATTTQGLNALAEFGRGLATNDLIANAIVHTENEAPLLRTFFRSLTLPGAGKATVSLVDSSGREILSNGGSVDYSSQPWLDSVMQGEEFAKIEYSHVLLAFPVLPRDHAEAAVVIQLSEQEFRCYLQASFPTSGRNLLLDSNQRVMASTHPNYQPGDEFRGPSHDTGSAILPARVKLLNERLLFYSFDAPHVFAGRKAALDRRLKIELFLNLGVIVFSVVMVARFASKNVNHLVGLVHEIEHSDSEDKQLQYTKGPTEIRTLAIAFCRAVAKLRNSSVSRNLLKQKNDALETRNAD